MQAKEYIEITERYSAHNYKPLDVVISKGKGCWVWDVDGHKYLDMLAAYSALNFGHGNERFLAVAHKQLDQLTLTSRAFYNDQLALFCKELAELAAMDCVLPMNSGAEAVESSIKIARKWGYEVKGVAAEQAEVIVFDNNFAGRTISIISFSSVDLYRENFGPFTPGFKIVAFGDLEALEKQINKNTVAILFEPVQGEGGVIVSPEGFIKGIRKLCSEHNILMIADEVQTGLCRTGRVFACEHEQVLPDLYVIGKSLGAGIVPISAVIGKQAVMDVLTPGTHGSTFGGNPFACSIAREVIAYIRAEQPESWAAKKGEMLAQAIRDIQSPLVQEVRGTGLMIGIDIDPEAGTAADYCKKLVKEFVLCKDTRTQTMRIAPPLIINEEEIEFALQALRRVLR